MALQTMQAAMQVVREQHGDKQFYLSVAGVTSPATRSQYKYSSCSDNQIFSEQLLSQTICLKGQAQQVS